MKDHIVSGLAGAALLVVLILLSQPIAHSKPVVNTMCIGTAKDRNAELHFDCSDGPIPAPTDGKMEVAFHKCYSMPDETSCMTYLVPKGYGPVYFEGFHW